MSAVVFKLEWKCMHRHLEEASVEIGQRLLCYRFEYYLSRLRPNSLLGGMRGV